MDDGAGEQCRPLRVVGVVHREEVDDHDRSGELDSSGDGQRDGVGREGRRQVVQRVGGVRVGEQSLYCSEERLAVGVRTDSAEPDAGSLAFFAEIGVVHGAVEGDHESPSLTDPVDQRVRLAREVWHGVVRSGRDHGREMGQVEVSDAAVAPDLLVASWESGLLETGEGSRAASLQPIGAAEGPRRLS